MTKTPPTKPYDTDAALTAVHRKRYEIENALYANEESTARAELLQAVAGVFKAAGYTVKDTEPSIAFSIPDKWNAMLSKEDFSAVIAGEPIAPLATKLRYCPGSVRFIPVDKDETRDALRVVVDHVLENSR
jgi:hypothetical protein